jgi:hypothetical protein
VPVESLLGVVAAAEQVEEEADRAAGLVGPAVLAIEGVRQYERLDLLGLVMAVQEFAQAARQERDHRRDVVAADAADAPSHPQRLEDAGQAAGVDVRGGFHEERLEVAGESLEPAVDRAERLGVSLRERAQLGHGAARVGPPGEVGVVGERHVQGGIAGHHAQPVGGERQLVDHLGSQHARDVGRRGGAAAGVDLLGDAAAAHDLAPLEHQRAQAGAGEVRGGGEAVVAGADDDRIPGVGGRRHARESPRRARYYGRDRMRA